MLFSQELIKAIQLLPLIGTFTLIEL